MENENTMEIENVRENESAMEIKNNGTWPLEPFYNPADRHKQRFPIYWASIQKYYKAAAAAAPRQGLRKLSAYDFHRTWKFGTHNRSLTPAIMKIAPSVVSVSIFWEVQRQMDCSGFIIEWDDSTGEATILTSAKIMKFPDGRDIYYIVVRLANGNILLAEEHYVDYYLNIVTLKVKSDVKLKPVEQYPYSLEVVEGDVVALGRDFYTCKLEACSGSICMDHPYFGCEHLVSSTCSGGLIREGGPLITRTGHVCGLMFYDGSRSSHPLSTLLIDSCRQKWTSCGISMRPWFGLNVVDYAQLPLDAMETIGEVSGDSTGTVVVREVYEGSPADEVGVHPGDVVTSLNNIKIFSVSQYAQELNSISGGLSAYCSNRTPDILEVCGYDSHIRKVVSAENLEVNDMKFWSSWLDKSGSDWCTNLLSGSQIEVEDEFRVFETECEYQFCW